MQGWQEKRREDLIELNLVAHVIAYLVAMFTLVFIAPFGEHRIDLHCLFTLMLLIPATLFILLDYHYLQRQDLSPRFILVWNLVKYLGLFLIVTLVYSTVQDERVWVFSALYLLPVVLVSITLGQGWGFLFSGGSLLSIFLNSYFYTGDRLLEVLETMLVPGSVFFLLAWLLGGIIKVERETSENLYSLALQDSITGLSTHRVFQECLNREVETTKQQQSPLSLVFVDIDYFRWYNKYFGHTFGDRILQYLAGLLKKYSPQRAELSRYSGDTFAVIMPETSVEEANEFAAQIASRVGDFELPYKTTSYQERLTVSVGVANYPEHASSVEGLLKAADSALYTCKTTGKNKIKFYQSVLEELIMNIGNDRRDIANHLRTLMSIISSRDRYTYGHSERVAYYARKIGEELNFNVDELHMIEICSFLHDLGKVEIDQEVLDKQGKLDDREWELIRQHPHRGVEMLKSLESLHPVIPAVLYHHENFNGTGYPNGASGEDIPQWARILRVADSFDAMTSSRPYKNIKTKYQALTELVQLQGTWYDPKIVNVFTVAIEPELNNGKG